MFFTPSLIRVPFRSWLQNVRRFSQPWLTRERREEGDTGDIQVGEEGGGGGRIYTGRGGERSRGDRRYNVGEV